MNNSTRTATEQRNSATHLSLREQKQATVAEKKSVHVLSDFRLRLAVYGEVAVLAAFEKNWEVADLLRANLENKTK